jgi:hypothetical protein
MDISRYQFVTFENPPIGPVGSGWTTSTETGYSQPTTFIVPASGYYLVAYKIDVRSGNKNQSSANNSSAVLTQNGITIKGSTSLVVSSESNNIYDISNTILCGLNINDKISLLFWSSNLSARIGDPSSITGILPSPSTEVPKEATASITITRITS